MNNTLKCLAIVIASLALPASASANQWYAQNAPGEHRVKVPSGGSVEVPTSGTYKLKIKLNGVHGAKKVVCPVTGVETLSNPTATEAIAQTSELHFACKGVVATPVLLPWSGELTGDCQPCFISRPEALEISIEGIDYGVFTGTVTAKIGDFDEPVHDDTDNVFRLMGKHGGELTSPQGSIVLSGSEQFGSKAAENRACGEPNGGATEEEGVPDSIKQEIIEGER